MTKNRYELDPERLATTDEHGHRVYLYPEDVKGKWKTRRQWVYWGLILLYLVLPWFYINGKPALMINIAQREFTLLGFTLHGMEPILFFLMLTSGLFFVAFMTSLLGRVWCGWGCPQTVFIQALFLNIERLIEGKARQREQLQTAPWNLEKISKRTLKWLAYLIISLHIAHTFIGYFVGPRELFWITMNPPTEHMGIFIATMIATAIILLDFGWFREQFCIIACPYGRIQSVMMDDNSKVVAYDVKRGEPRRGTIPKENEGDCVNCYNCVKVCPTGIDIRRGTQLECIACTQCIDACDDIMTRLKKPTGLIRYSTENELKGEKRKTLTVRSVLYLAVCIAFVLSFFIFFRSSTQLQAVFLRGTGAPFVISTNQEGQRIISNHFTIKLKHQGSRDFDLVLQLSDKLLRPLVQITQPVKPWRMTEAELRQIVFIRFNHELLTKGSKTLNVELIDLKTNEIVLTKEVNLVGPVE
ncbi:MAG: cytochrome c oxidase accessory protein CcoG [Bacteriovoracia bacterium]